MNEASSGERTAAMLDMAAASLGRGAPDTAIDLLRQVLGEAPDHAGAHALLALALLASKRVHAAEHEASLALRLDPQNPDAHLVMGRVAMARRRFDRADEHLSTARQLAPESTVVLQAVSALRQLQRRRGDALELLERARELDPEEPSVLADLADLHLDAGRIEEAERTAREALELEPEHSAALVCMGRVRLQRGDVEGAREHAAEALRDDPNDGAALRLLADIKARQNKLLGLWWRFSVWLGTLGSGRALMVLLGTFLVYRVLSVDAKDAGNELLGNTLHVVWLAICAYTWIAPGIFARSVRRELGEVTLRDDY